MNRIDRLNAILIQLQSKRRVTLQEIEDKFELSRRTIFRDIKALLESGVPIGGNAGDGYFIVEGYHLPPVVFNKEEASAILLGAKFVEQNADLPTVKTFQAALDKVRAVLRYSDKEFLESLENNVSVLPSPRNIKDGFPDSHLSEIQYAIASRRTIQISYYSNYNDQTTNREVEPLGMVFYSGRWHLIGYCHLREDLRDFRTDRITEIEITGNEFQPEAHPDCHEFLMHMVTGTDALEARIVINQRIARFITDQKYYYGFAEEIPHKDGIEMRFYTPSYDFFTRWLLSFGDQVKVLYPDTLKDKVRELSMSIAEHHKKFS